MQTLRGRNGKYTNTAMENEEMLSCESCPLKENHQYYELPPAGSAHTRITEQAVERSFNSQSVKKAPGPDKLSFGAIQLL